MPPRRSQKLAGLGLGSITLVELALRQSHGNQIKAAKLLDIRSAAGTCLRFSRSSVGHMA